MTYKTYIKSEGTNYCEILGSVIGQMSDGIWENTRSMERYWKSLNYGVDEHGYIYLEDRYGVVSDVAEFFANKIKQIVKIDNDDNGGLEWTRYNSNVVNYMGYHSEITVGECYKLYELLKGRDISKKQYAIIQKYNVEISLMGNNFQVEVKATNKYAAEREARKQISEMAHVRVI